MTTTYANIRPNQRLNAKSSGDHARPNTDKTQVGSDGSVKTRSYDPVLTGSLAILLCLGVILIYSASSVFAGRVYSDAQHFLKLHLLWLLLGLVGLRLAASIKEIWLKRLAGWALLVTTFLCVLVLFPGVGQLAGGARRWLSFGVVGFQPSEFAKLSLVVFLAALLARRDLKPENERMSLLVPILLAQIPVALILAEPDLGNALVIEIIVASMVFVAGLRVRTLILVGLGTLPIFYHFLVGTPFRLQRLLSFIDPWAYRSTIGYQVTEALISIGAGGIFGVGLGESKHKLFFLPAAHTDFVFAIIAEELGFVGVVVILAAFLALIWRGAQIAARAGGGFTGYLAIGLTALVGVPAAFNMCVATGLLPTKGLPLPFLSYGGSNLVATLLALGMLLRLAKTRFGLSKESPR